ncbi:MAG: MBL fold metallo-hydrolase [Deltaproteobacteria bacterium]|nr:MBL fold metallo-hydrolase [Deltaproteobacteria bacterium]
MNITWFGTAGFKVETGNFTVLIDPYFSRNQQAVPRQPIRASDIEQADMIFISHGHFDHILDVPEIAASTKARVYCGRGTDGTMIRKGLDKDLIHRVVSDGEIFNFGDFQAQAFYSRHVKFDSWLLFKTLARINFRIPGYLPLLREYPEGQVLSWRFLIEGKAVHHFGSGGSTADELENLGRQPTDILLVPMQGHTRIDRIAHQYVKALQPEMVIPHHQDNFYPPISTMVDTRKFIQLVKGTNPDTAIRIPVLNETMEW